MSKTPWKHRFSEDELKEAIRTSFSFSETLRKLKIVPAGGNYETVRNKVQILELDTSHFSGHAWNKGKKTGHKRDLSNYLTNGLRNSNRLRQRLLSEGIFKHICSNCNLSKWMEKLIPLELDHINGIRTDNRLENLRLLCPNCHALTPTYRGRNIRARSEMV